MISLPGVKGLAGTAPHFIKDVEDKLHAPAGNEEVRRCQLIWASWLHAKLEEAKSQADLLAIKHWKRLLEEFLEKTNIEPYVSPFTGKLDFGY